ncbi:MAG: NAD(P)H-hydrate dehydratase [Faecalibacterium sp.]
MKYSFAPLVNNQCSLLILGSLPGEESLRQVQYYAHPRNAFWRILCDVFAEDFTEDYAARCALALRHGVALWDVIGAAEREGSLDTAIRNPAVNDFAAFLRAHPSIRKICLNGGKAEQLFKRHCKDILADPQMANIQLIALPSTSPANAKMCYDQKLAQWRKAISQPLPPAQTVQNAAKPISPAAPLPTITLDPTLPFFSPRARETHKGSYGTLLLICGSYGMIGAAAMAAKAALRCGVGLVNVVTDTTCYPLLAPMLSEAVFTVLDATELAAFPACYTANPAPQGGAGKVAVPASAKPNARKCHNASHEKLLQALRKASACVIGCGLGADAALYLPTVLAAAECPIVADADALNYLAQHPDLFQTVHAPLLLTPHPAEMARLCNKTTKEIQAERAGTAIAFAMAQGAYTILKGADTVVATPEGDAKTNPTGTAGMAKGGSGDVLAGMLGAFLAQKITPVAAAEAAVYIHGAVGELCAAALSQTSMQPTDLIAALPAYFKQHLHE